MTDDRPSWARSEVTIHVDKPLRLSSNAMRALHKATGRPLSEILQDTDDEESRWQATAFGDLYRRAVDSGHMPDASTLWEWAGDIDLTFTVDTAPMQITDPLEPGYSTTSQDSAATGE